MSIDKVEILQRRGYKKTKLGWIPEEWDLEKLGDLSLIKGQYGVNEAAVDYNPNLPAYIRITDITEEGWFDDRKRKSVNISETENYTLKEGDVVFARTGATVGRTYLHDKSNIPFVFAGFLIRFRVDQNKIKSLFLKYYTQTSYYWKWVSTYSVRSGQPGINGKEYCSLPISLPPIQEQKAIANCLATWDTAIEKQTQLVQAKQTQKKALMQQLLTGKKRLPGFTEGRKKYKFDQITERITRKNKELDDTVVTISAQRGVVLQEDFFNKRVASKTLSNYTLVHKGEFCYNKSYSKGYPMGAFKRLDDFEKAVVTTLYICFKLKDNVNSDFMNHYFNGGRMIKGLMRIAQEGGRAHGLLNISLPDFFNLKVTIPERKEQAAIAMVLNTADKEIEILEAQLVQLQQQKKGLMQQLLTGKKRLKY